MEELAEGLDMFLDSGEPEEVVDDALDDGEPTPEDLREISHRIDDSSGMYLKRIGAIPLLSREKEIGLAKEIEVTRERFRRKVLG